MDKNIYELLIQLDANKSESIQENAIEELKKEKDLSVFMQPNGIGMGKKIWENCASILCSKTDDKLIPYIKSLLEWLQDMNWPGAWQILERIEKIPKEKYYDIYVKCLNKAYKELEKEHEEEYVNSWASNLKMIYSDKQEKDFL